MFFCTLALHGIAILLTLEHALPPHLLQAHPHVAGAHPAEEVRLQGAGVLPVEEDRLGAGGRPEAEVRLLEALHHEELPRVARLEGVVLQGVVLQGVVLLAGEARHVAEVSFSPRVLSYQTAFPLQHLCAPSLTKISNVCLSFQTTRCFIHSQAHLGVEVLQEDVARLDVARLDVALLAVEDPRAVVVRDVYS